MMKKTLYKYNIFNVKCSPQKTNECLNSTLERPAHWYPGTMSK